MSRATRFILARAAALLVEGYKQCIAEYQTVLPLALGISKDAPNSYEALKAEAQEGKLNVSTEFNSMTIYGGAGNLTFRVFHDYGHLLYDAKFTTNEEILLANTQWQDLKRYIPAEWLEICFQVYYADTVEQSKFEALHGGFPDDQKHFVLGHLNKFLNERN